MSKDTLTITIDGNKVTAKPGQTIMEAADDAGVYIPRLCWHKDLPNGGNCRVCTVKVDGRPQASCVFPAEDGQNIENDTPELKDFRCKLVEMHFVEGNHYCPSCEVSGECELQATAYRLGMITPTLPYMRPKHEVDASHPDIYIDRDRCILCGRCIRASQTVDGKSVFGFVGRGVKTKIAVNAEHDLGETTMTKADKAAEVCPTGAIVIKGKGFSIPYGQRKYDKKPIGSDIEQK